MRIAPAAPWAPNRAEPQRTTGRGRYRTAGSKGLGEIRCDSARLKRETPKSARMNAAASVCRKPHRRLTLGQSDSAQPSMIGLNVRAANALPTNQLAQ